MKKGYISCVTLSLFALLPLCFVSGYADAQTFTEDVWIYDEGLKEAGGNVAADKLGNTYITVSKPLDDHDLIIKYNPSGSIKWTKPYSGELNGLAVGASDNVYVIGNSFNGSDDDCDITKYHKSKGRTIWQRRYDGGNDDTCNNIATDSNGYVYVAGTHFLNDTAHTNLLIKYDSQGNVVCSNTANTCGATPVACGALDIAVDGGNIYLYSTGTRQIVKYDEFCQFVTYWFTPPYIQDIAANEAGQENVYAVASSTGASGNYDYLLVKYDSSGNETCRATYDGGARDTARSVVEDGMGNAYVTGSSWNGSNDDILTVKYDSSCYEVWQSPLTWYGGAVDLVNGIDVDDNANIYITGLTYKDIFDLNYDAVTIKFSPDNSVCDNEGPFDDPTCNDNLDNDCDGDIDEADMDCQEMINCSNFTTSEECRIYPECRWNKKKGCLDR